MSIIENEDKKPAEADVAPVDVPPAPEEEAVEIAMERLGCDTISLCWECSRKVGELTISCNDEDIEVEEVTD